LAARKMSKKNNLAKRKKQHEFDLQREKEAKEKLAKKLQAKKSKMKVLSTSSTSPFLSMDESFVV
jgi:ribosomal protein L9